MINEQYQINDILEGKDLGKYTQFRITYLLARYYKDMGLPPVDIRNKIFSWCKEHKYFISENVNNIIQLAQRDTKPFVRDVDVCVSDEEIEDIRMRFDLEKTRITALAILCYAKCYADKRGYIKLPQQELSAWVGISRQYLNRSIMPELISFGYIEEVDKFQKSRFNKLTGAYNYSAKMYRLAVRFDAVDGHHFDGTDITDFYRRIF